jgi:WhiB family transcriptional regulator, redox-sensing transcriptional regulator
LVAVDTIKKRERTIMLKEWLDQAACRGFDTNIFMPLRGENVKVTTAKKICGECPVRQECLDDSLRQAQQIDLHGIFGGLSKKQRDGVLRSRNLVSARSGVYGNG